MEFKTLFIDIETSPNIGLFWRPGRKISIGPENIIRERGIICICYKWKGESTVHSLTWNKRQCDRSMLKRISRIMLKADEIVGHNGDKFDIKFIQGRLLYHNLPPLGPLSTTDTLKQSRKVFLLNSQKLDYLGTYMKLGKKLDTGGFSLWKDILLNKSESAMLKMVKYCKQDVLLLEKVYDRVLQHAPRFNKSVAKQYKNVIKAEHPECAVCLGKHIKKNSKYTTVGGARYQTYMCHDCGAISKFLLKK